MKNKNHYKNESEGIEGSYFNFFLRLVFLGIGLGVISGTLLKIININNIGNNISDTQFINPKKKGISEKANKEKLSYLRNRSRSLHTSKNQNIIELSEKWQKLAESKKDLKASAYLLLIDKKEYAEFQPNLKLSAASSIKIAVLVALLEMIDSGHIRWNEELKLTSDVIGGEAGWMAYQKLGTSFPTYEVATEMIRISDNTATNLLIKRIGGIEEINRKFKSLGMYQTHISMLLPDLGGTNKTTAKDLADLLAAVDRGYILSQRTRDLFREVMSTSTSNRLIPGGLLKGLNGTNSEPDYNLMIKGYKVFNKTGDIGIAYADAALIQLPNNTRAVAGFIVEGPFNDPRSAQLIRDMSAAMASFLNTPNKPFQ